MKKREDFQKTRNISQHLLFSIFQLTQHSSPTADNFTCASSIEL